MKLGTTFLCLVSFSPRSSIPDLGSGCKWSGSRGCWMLDTWIQVTLARSLFSGCIVTDDGHSKCFPCWYHLEVAQSGSIECYSMLSCTSFYIPWSVLVLIAWLSTGEEIALTFLGYLLTMDTKEIMRARVHQLYVL